MTTENKILNESPLKSLPEFGYRPDPQATQRYSFALFIFWGAVLLL